MQAPGFRIGEIELALGAGDAYVAQAALFLQAVGVLDGAAVGEDALFHAGQKHQGELQALGGVQGHELHAVLVLLALPLAGLQGGMGQEGGQGFHVQLLAVVFELAGGAHQLLQVFDARQALFALFLLVVLQQPAAGNDMVDLLVQFQVAGVLVQAFHQLQELAQGIARARRQFAGGGELARGLPQGQAGAARQSAYLLHGALADAAGGGVHHALEGRVVAAVGHQAQVGQGIFDLRPFEEAEAAVDPVGDAGGDQGFFEDPRLGVGAVEHRGLAARVALFGPVADARGDEARLVQVVEGGIELQGFALDAVGPQFLAQASAVVVDEGVGGLEDGAGGAVVLFQAHHLHILEVLGEALDVFDARPAPAVDGLVVVAHHEQVAAAAGQQAQPGILDGVGVLELVHQDVAEAVLVVGQDLGVVAPQFMGAQQQFGEVHHPGAAAGVLVGLVDAHHLAHEGVAAVVDVARALALVLAGVDEPLYLARRPLGLV